MAGNALDQSTVLSSAIRLPVAVGDHAAWRAGSDRPDPMIYCGSVTVN